MRQPFFCNVGAQAAAIEALRHGDEVERRVEHTIASRFTLVDGLLALGLPVAQSEANFVWHGLPESIEEPAVVDGLAKRGVLVRAGTALGREGYLRVTLGTDRENARFLAELATLLGPRRRPRPARNAPDGEEDSDDQPPLPHCVSPIFFASASACLLAESSERIFWSFAVSFAFAAASRSSSLASCWSIRSSALE